MRNEKEPGVLSDENKLDGEGPFRVVVPQKFVGPPDQSSQADYQPEEWAYNSDWDHNAGACTRSATIVKVEPLPGGTIDISVLEAGWNYVDQEKIIIYGAIDGADSNGNGILDSEEGTDATNDLDADSIPDYQDPDTAAPRHAKGTDHIRLRTSAGQFAAVKCMAENEPGLPSDSLPSGAFPYGVTGFKITGLAPNAQVTVTLEYLSDVPDSASYYKVNSAGQWVVIPHTAGDNARPMRIQLTDGDPTTDSEERRTAPSATLAEWRSPRTQALTQWRRQRWMFHFHSEPFLINKSTSAMVPGRSFPCGRDQSTPSNAIPFKDNCHLHATFCCNLYNAEFTQDGRQ